MAFHNTRLSDEVERGAQGGPGFKTTVLQLSSGFEQRNIDWTRARGEWDISYGLDTKAQIEAVLAFFYARQGRAHGFRFKDWSDFEIGTDATDTLQQMGVADGTLKNFQFLRRYSSGGTDFDREITRLVASPTPRVFKDAAEQGSGFTVDNDTGVITFTVAPANGVVIGGIAEFDIPVRFDQDQLDLQAMFVDQAGGQDVISAPSIVIKELREVLTVLV